MLPVPAVPGVLAQQLGNKSIQIAHDMYRNMIKLYMSP